ncbi:hypothetical protein M0804_014835 [Polistes exclamans]|nr:hypothetical protein M0804_014835 [Polistes exclamans]
MKRCYLENLKVIKALDERLGARMGKDHNCAKAIVQLRAENKAKVAQNKVLTEEIARLWREMQKGVSNPSSSNSKVAATKLIWDNRFSAYGLGYGYDQSVVVFIYFFIYSREDLCAWSSFHLFPSACG